MSSQAHSAPDPEPIASEYYRHLCQYAGVGLIATNTALEIVFWNPSATRIFGGSSESMIGQPIASIVPNERRTLAVQQLRRTIERKEISEFEIRHRDAKGDPMYLAITVSPVLDAQGNAIGASTCFRDITRRVELERKLAQGQRLASLGTFASGIAHHFNNILGGIATTVDFALEAGDPLTAKRALTVTAKAVTRASSLVQNLLTFAEGDREDADLADATEAVCYFLDMIEPELRRDNIELDLVLGPKTPFPVPFHRTLSMLSSLVTNAREAMPDGGTLRVAVNQESDALILEIGDTGAGIPEDHLERVLEPFFSTKQDTGHGIPRLGLGLAVVHGIVTDLQGTIRVRSQFGRGTNVEIKIPQQAELTSE